MSGPAPWASIDIGSNSILLLIAERDGAGGWRRLHEEAHITRISEGLDRGGCLQPAAVERTAAVLAAYRSTCSRLHVAKVLATGTAPFRRASNGPEVAAALSEVLGAPLDIVSGEEEALLSLLAARTVFPSVASLRVVDIGGASTELALVRGEGEAPLVVSIDLGSVRLHERFGARDSLGGDDVAALRALVRDALAAPDLRPILDAQDVPLVGIAGTVTTLAALDQRMEVYDADAIQGYPLSAAALDDAVALLTRLSVAERAALPGVDPKRADVIAAGALLLQEIARACGVERVHVSDRGVRWGRLLRDGR